MSHPIQNAQEEIKITLWLIGEVEERVLREFDELKTLRELTAEAQRVLPAIKDYRVRQATEKSIQRKGNKIKKRIKRAERMAYALSNRLTKEERDLLRVIPTTYHNDIHRFLQQIEVHTAALLAFVSGQMTQFDHLGDTEVTLLKDAQKTITGALQPLTAALEELRNYIESHQEAMLNDIRSTITITVDLDSVLRVRGLRPGSAEVLIDANFAREMEQERLRDKKTQYDLHLTGQPLVIPQRVVDEMRRRHGMTREPTVSRQLISYLCSRGRVEDIRPTSGQQRTITDAWRSTFKGKSATEYQQELFQNSGDMSLLTRALERGLLPTVILSNDSDIVGVVEELRIRPRTPAVSVISLRNGRLILAA